MDEESRLFVSVSDIPCITAEIIRKISDAYRSSGKDACSTWVPAQLVRSIRFSMPYQQEINGVNACPAGVNVLRGDIITHPQDEIQVLLPEPGLALNVNTWDDRANAEEYIKTRIPEKKSCKPK